MNHATLTKLADGVVMAKPSLPVGNPNPKQNSLN
jgi:hypothetical protein